MLICKFMQKYKRIRENFLRNIKDECLSKPYYFNIISLRKITFSTNEWIYFYYTKMCTYKTILWTSTYVVNTIIIYPNQSKSQQWELAWDRNLMPQESRQLKFNHSEIGSTQNKATKMHTIGVPPHGFSKFSFPEN